MKKLILISTLSFAFVGTSISFSRDQMQDENISCCAYECEKIDTDEIPALGRPAYIPTDEYYSSQQYVSMNHLGNIEKVWDQFQGEGLTVAIIDSGIDYLHPDFYDEDGNSRIRIEDARWYAHITNNDGSGTYTTTGSTGTLVHFPVDGRTRTIDGVKYKDKEIIKHSLTGKYSSHGTNVAGTAAAYNHQNLHTGTIGIAPKAKILPIKVDFYTDSVGAALGYIYELNTDSDPTNNVDVVNISIEADSTWTTITSNASKLVNCGTIIVAAAGNSTSDVPSYPAAEANIIGVGALEDNSSTALASYSNFNRSWATASTSTNNTDIVAPGQVYAPDYDLSHTYIKTHGTSFASPIVAGAAVLWKEANPDGTVSEFKDQLYNSCIDLGTSGWDYKFGYGRLNIHGLLDIGSPNEIVINNTEVVDNELTLEVGETFDLDWTVLGVGTFNHGVSFSTLMGQDDVLTVDSNGRITAVGEGEEFVVIESLVDSNVVYELDVNIVNITPKVSSVSVSPSVLDLDLNGIKSSTLTATVNGTNDPPQTVSWTTNNASVATVSSSGVVTAKGVGTATITATSTFDSTKSATCTVNVSTHRVVMEKEYGNASITWPSTAGASISGLTGLSVTGLKNNYYESGDKAMRLGVSGGPGEMTINSSIGNFVSFKLNLKAYNSSRTGNLTVGDNVVNVTNYSSYYDTETLSFSEPSGSILIKTASSSVRINIKRIDVVVCTSEEDIGKTDDCVGLETFITNYMHMDYTENLGYCKDSEHHYYSSAKTAFNILNNHQRLLFTTNEAYDAEWTRLSMWAEVNGDTLNNNNQLSGSNIGLGQAEQNQSTTLIVVIASASITSLGLLLIVKKRKHL